MQMQLYVFNLLVLPQLGNVLEEFSTFMLVLHQHSVSWRLGKSAMLFHQVCLVASWQGTEPDEPMFGFGGSNPTRNGGPIYKSFLSGSKQIC